MGDVEIGMEVSADVRRLNPGVFEHQSKATPPSKYHNCRTEARGMVFDSGKEATGIAGLIILDEQHKIFGLRLQVVFPLHGGETYRADAVYSETVKGLLVLRVVDFKGYRTREFKRKAKHFKQLYGMEIECR